MPVTFRIDEWRVVLADEIAGELSDRLHALAADDMEHPAYGAARLIDFAIEGFAPDPQPEWHEPEKDALRGVLDSWLHEVKEPAFDDALMSLRYHLWSEAMDRLPAGLYHFVLDGEGGAERDAVDYRDRAPVPGQPIVIQGRTYIVRDVVQAPGSDYVAIVTATAHPG